MKTSKLLKSLLSEAYEVEGELLSLIEQCFKEIFKEESILAYSFFEEDFESGRECNGCFQNLEYFQNRIEECKKEREKRIKANETKKECK